MNSYGSVSLVSKSIYRVIRYMNWINAPTAAADADDAAAAVDAAEHNS
jgi:hypothetical protein